ATVSEKAWRAEGSRMFIEPKKAVSVDELLHGEIVQSGNDAAIALAEVTAGSEAAFVERMNREAARMGMKGTRFVNVTGLPAPQQVSTATARADRRGRHPGFPGVLPALFDQGVPLQQHHAIESQPAALERPVRRRR